MFTKLHRSQINFNVKGLYGPKAGLVEDKRYIYIYIYITIIYLYTLYLFIYILKF